MQGERSLKFITQLKCYLAWFEQSIRNWKFAYFYEYVDLNFNSHLKWLSKIVQSQKNRFEWRVQEVSSFLFQLWQHYCVTNCSSHQMKDIWELTISPWKAIKSYIIPKFQNFLTWRLRDSVDVSTLSVRSINTLLVLRGPLHLIGCVSYITALFIQLIKWL